jgi:hypothetical protein
MGRGICLELVVFTRKPCLLLGEIVSTIYSEKRSLARRVSAMQKPFSRASTPSNTHPEVVQRSLLMLYQSLMGSIKLGINRVAPVGIINPSHGGSYAPRRSRGRYVVQGPPR